MRTIIRQLIVLLALWAIAAPAVCASDMDSVPDANQRLWSKDKREFRLGYTMADFDRGPYNGGILQSRFGIALDMMGNVYLHRKAIGGFLKFGIQFGGQINYINFEKGKGKLSLGGMFNGADEGDSDSNYEDITIGTHLFVAGIGVGPTATFMPFFKSNNPNLARLRFRVYFNVVPSYSGFIKSNEDDTQWNSAFACNFASGLNIFWRKLDIGFQYKGGKARYRDTVSDIEESVTGVSGFEKGKMPRFATNLYTISIGIVF